MQFFAGPCPRHIEQVKVFKGFGNGMRIILFRQFFSGSGKHRSVAQWGKGKWQFVCDGPHKGAKILEIYEVRRDL